MKNKYMTFVALAVAALATSCASDDLAEQKKEQNQNELRTVTLTASVADDNTTRVGMAKDGTTAKFYWQSDDKILVQTQKDENYSGAEFTATVNASDKTKAEFTGNIAEGTAVAGYAVYPYSENQKHTFNASNANELTYVLPATYTNYTPATQIFGNDGISTNMPMFGKIESGKITFKHLGGLAVIRVDKMPDASGTLTITADQQLSGDFTVSDLSADEAKIATTTASGDNGKVTFTFSGATADGVGVFYLPLATGSYTNVEIVLSWEGGSQTMNWASIAVDRAKVIAIPVAMNTVINDHTFVDLGLSVLWAETNIGASTATDYGNYYAWAGTSTQGSYNEGDAPYYSSDSYSYTKYPSGSSSSYDDDYDSSSINVLSVGKHDDDYYDPDDAAAVAARKCDDAACYNWHEPCRMPTQAEFQELINNCTWTLIPQNHTEDEPIDGYKVTSRKNGNSIFLPVAGYKEDISTSLDGWNGYYWSSTLYSGDNNTKAYHLSFSDTMEPYIGYDNRYIGYSVRPVAAKQ